MKIFSVVIILFPIASFSFDVSRLNVREFERERIIAAADSFLQLQPATITSYPSPRSAGGIHDFSSDSDYWWPDPQNPDGPYIRRDGMTNPENFVEHRKAMIRFSIHVGTLTSAWRITGKKRYAEHAVKHLNAWFVADATKMNPQLLYAQAVKGRSTGRGTGIIDTIHLIEVARCVLILEQSGVMSPGDENVVRKWFADYVHWMMTHQYGLEERDAKNNHGACWVMQVAAFAQAAGDTATLHYCRERFKTVLLPGQVASDGSFPLELQRTKPYGYSIFNLDVFATICQILSTSEDNLWNYTLPDGRSMRKAIEFLYPYLNDKSSWPYPRDVMYWDEWPVAQPCLLFAGIALEDVRYLDLWKSLNHSPTNGEVIRNLPVRHPLLWVD